MSTQLSIQVHSSLQPSTAELEFSLTAENNADAEKILLQRLVGIICRVRDQSTKMCIRLEFDTSDPGEAIFLLKKTLYIKAPETGPPIRFSGRELEILRLIMQGHTNQQIARQLFISFETVRSHRKHILSKTGMSNTASLVHYCHENVF